MWQTRGVGRNCYFSEPSCSGIPEQIRGLVHVEPSTEAGLLLCCCWTDPGLLFDGARLRNAYCFYAFRHIIFSS